MKPAEVLIVKRGTQIISDLDTWILTQKGDMENFFNLDLQKRCAIFTEGFL